MRFLLNVILTCSILFSSAAPKVQYRTVHSGMWNDLSVWQTFDGNQWIAANSLPAGTNQILSISAGDTLRIDGSFAIDTLNVYGNLSILSGGNISFTSLSGFLHAYTASVIENSGLITGAVQNIRFDSGSRYIHNNISTEGVIPLAIWDPNSIIEITGYVSAISATDAGNWNQSFGNFIWRTSNLTGDINLNGKLQNIRGNFEIVDTGSGILRFSWNTNLILNIEGSFEVKNLSRFSVSKSSANTNLVDIRIRKDFIFNSNNSLGSWIDEQGNSIWKIDGNFIMNTGIIYFNSGAGATSTSGTTIYVKGNFNLQGGTLDARAGFSNRVGDLYFNGVTEQLFVNTGTILGKLNYHLASGCKVRIGDGQAFVGQSFECGDLTGGATLVVESLDPLGAIQKGATAGGNIRVTTQVFRPGSVIVYGGTSKQYIGNGHPATTGINCIVNNLSDVEVCPASATLVLGGNLEIVQGNLRVSSNNLTVRGNLTLSGGNLNLNTTQVLSSLTITIDGKTELTSSDILVTSSYVNNASNAVLIFNGDFTGNHFINFSGSNCQVQITGPARILSRPLPLNASSRLESLSVNSDGTILQIDRDLQLGNFTSATGAWSGGLTIIAGKVKMNAGLVVLNELNLSGGILNFENQTLELQRNILTNSPKGVLQSNSFSTLKITSSFAGMNNTLAFDPALNTIGTLILDRTANVLPISGTIVSPHVTLNSPLAVSKEFFLKDGEFFNQSGLSLSAGAKLIRTPDAGFSSATTSVVKGGPYDLYYNQGISSNPVMAGIETTGSIRNLFVNLPVTVSFKLPLIVNNRFEIIQGTADLNNITTADSIINKSVLMAPADLQITSHLNNSGVFLNRSGKVSFVGSGSISGSVIPEFHNLYLQRAFTLPSKLIVNGDLINNGIIFPNAGIVQLNGKSKQQIGGTTKLDLFDLFIGNNSDTVKIQNAVAINGSLELAPRAILNAGLNQLNLIYTDKNHQGKIGILDSSSKILGSVTMQRFVPGSGSGYRYLASPLVGYTISDLSGYFPFDKFFLFNYDETVTGVKTAGFNIPKLSDPMQPGRGYVFWPTGQEAFNGIYWSASGTLQSGVNRDAVDFNIHYTPTSGGSYENDGWNLLGNPYPSPVIWTSEAGAWSDNFNGQFRGIDPVVYVWDNNSGNYQTWNALTGMGDLSESTGIIPAGQAFWVHAYQPNPSLVIHESAKTSRNAEMLRIDRRPVQGFAISLIHGNRRSNAFFAVHAGASEKFDPGKDALQMTGSMPAISLLAQDGIPLVHYLSHSIPDSIDLKFHQIVPGVYKFQLDTKSELSNADFWLLDKQTGNRKKLLPSEEINLDLNGPGDSLRYRLVSNVDDGKFENSEDFKIFPNPSANRTIYVQTTRAAGFKVTIRNAIGVPVQNFELEQSEKQNQFQISLKNLPSGLYILTLQDGVLVQSKKFLVQ